MPHTNKKKGISRIMTAITRITIFSDPILNNDYFRASN